MADSLSLVLALIIIAFVTLVITGHIDLSNFIKVEKTLPVTKTVESNSDTQTPDDDKTPDDEKTPDDDTSGSAPPPPGIPYQPPKLALGERCTETSECNRNLECRTDYTGEKKCLIMTTSDMLPGADQVQIEGTQIGEINDGDKFFIRNRHKGRCLGRDAKNALIHSRVGPLGETIPCDIHDPNFHWVSEEIQGTNKKKYRMINTNLCLALDGMYRPSGQWVTASQMSLVSCTDRDPRATGIELFQLDVESGTVDGEFVTLNPYNLMKSHSLNPAACMELGGWEATIGEQKTPRLTQCEHFVNNTFMHWNFPKIV